MPCHSLKANPFLIYFFICRFLVILMPSFFGMKIVLSAFIAFALMPFFSCCQTTEKIADQAFIITRMVNKFHAEPRMIDNAFSESVFKGMLDRTDPEKIFFLNSDISRLKFYDKAIDNEIKQRKTAYLNLFISIYKLRLAEADSMIDKLGQTPFNYYADERLTAAEDISYPVFAAGMQLKLHRKIKEGALDGLEDALPANFKSFTAAKQKKYADSLIIRLQKKFALSLKRRITRILQNPAGITQYTGDLYCETIASCFDPHTEFFPPQQKETFENALGKQPFIFGFRVKADKNGGVLIDNLQPGSPAFKSGKLNKGDKFVTLQWDGSQPVDVSDMSIYDFNDLVDEGNNKRASFTVKKANGLLVQVALEKQLAADDGDEKVKSFILKGNNNIGYIYLPAFYEDWESGNNGLNGCANDVGREILKLKKENVSGIILDLRYNGGGSVSEAAALTGIFIDAGPVAQEAGRDAKPSTIKDTDRGTLYDGPLVILVNGYSASASEMVAGTLQDYNRAVIIGAPTYGKATMQVVLPMDTTVTPENFREKNTENYLKLTIAKLYRVTGQSAQLKGVQPDIILPDILDAFITREADAPDALRPGFVTPNKYYQPFAPLPIQALQQIVKQETDTSAYFTSVLKLIAASKQKKELAAVSLNLKDVIAGIDTGESKTYAALITGTRSKKFSVKDNKFESAAEAGNEDLKEINEDFRKQVASDAAIAVAYSVLTRL